MPYSDDLLCDIEKRVIIHNQSFDPMFSIDAMIDLYGKRSNLELAIVSRSNFSPKLKEWVGVSCVRMNLGRPGHPQSLKDVAWLGNQELLIVLVVRHMIREG